MVKKIGGFNTLLTPTIHNTVLTAINSIYSSFFFLRSSLSLFSRQDNCIYLDLFHTLPTFLPLLVLEKKNMKNYYLYGIWIVLTVPHRYLSALRDHLQSKNKKFKQINEQTFPSEFNQVIILTSMQETHLH